MASYKTIYTSWKGNWSSIIMYEKKWLSDDRLTSTPAYYLMISANLKRKL